MNRQNPRVIAEVHYWNFGEFNETAMDRRSEVDEEELKRIARKHDVTLSCRRKSARFWMPSRLGSVPRYEERVVEVAAHDEDSVRDCLREIFKMYGRPDEIPSPIFGEKRLGRRIVGEALKENRLGNF